MEIVLGLGLVCGYLVWRGSGNIWRGILAGLTLPIAGLIAFGAVIGRENLQALDPSMLPLVAIAGLVGLAIIFRNG